ncbi:exodeoxyribonuclease V subunit gamma [soil metagenome]
MALLSVVRAATGTALADALADVLAVPLSDPLATEQIVVHTRGMERWLGQHLSRRLGVSAGGAVGDGVCANVAFPFPIEVVRRAIRATGGPDLRASAWEPDRLVWPLMAAVDGGLGGWGAPLTDRFAADPAARFDVLRGVADLLDRYAVHRPDLVLRWLDGEDVAADGSPLGRADIWQPHLLRLLRQQVDQPTLAESVVSATAGLPALRPGHGLPSRISVFGFTALPAAHLAVLVAMASVVDVTLFLLHPSPGLWQRWEGAGGEVRPDGLPVLPLREGLDLASPRNRLLRSWGRDAAEMQLVVTTIAGRGAAASALDAAAASALDAAAGALLGRLQADVAADQPVTSGPPVAADDHSVQIHACHGRTRQVQVLRDEILRLLSADPTLQPRDIVVMCPDVEAFAPLVTAHLAIPADDPEGRPDLRVRLADRALKQINPMLRFLDDLLAAADDRITAGRLLDLAGADPVRRRFGFGDDDLERLADWARGSGMRWGLDTVDRARDGVVQDVATIGAGLSRVLLGAAMADEDQRTIAGVTPMDDVEGGDVALAGRLAELVARLQQVLAAVRTPQPVRGWVTALTDAADLLLREPAAEPWQRTQLTTLLDGVAEDARGSDVTLSLAEVRSLLGDRLRGQPSWANHRTGDLTVCTLVPMRSVPHRVVCLLGMDDEVFPRRPHARGDDLIARHPRVGDRDLRTEDRQLLLDALMSAGDALVITYAGIDERTGETRPPCVPVAELARTIDAAAPGGAATVTTSHPLHPHDPLAFVVGRPGFDRQAFAAASLTAPRTARPAVQPLVAVEVPAVLDVDRLVAFVANPVGYWFRHAAGTYVPDDPEQIDSLVPITLDGLTGWALGQALMADGQANDPDHAARAEQVLRGRGLLPPTPLAQKQIRKATDSARDITGLCARLGLPMTPGLRRQVEAVIGVRTITGTVGGVHGTSHVSLSYSKLRAKAIAGAWVRLLALTADDPDQPWDAFVVGRHETKEQQYRPVPHAVRFAPLGATPDERRDTACTLLEDLFALHDDGLHEPLVVPALTACAYAMARVLRMLPPSVADDHAAERWDPTDRGFDNEALLPAHLLLFGDAAPYDDLRRDPPRPQDTLPGQDPEPHRLGGLAMRLWSPILTRCKAATA